MIYPIDQMMENFFNSITDEETGELTMADEDVAKAVAALKMEHDEKVDNLCAIAKNSKADAADIRVEKMKLAKWQKTAENRAEWAKRFLGYLLQGEKYKSARHSLYYLENDVIAIDDRDQLLAWCKENAPEFLNKPTLREDDIKKAIQSGRDIPFAHIEKNRSVVVR